MSICSGKTLPWSWLSAIVPSEEAERESRTESAKIPSSEQGKVLDVVRTDAGFMHATKEL